MRWQSAAWTLILLGLAGLRAQADAPAGKPVPGSDRGAPITLKEFESLARKAPVQGTDEQRRAFEKEVAAFGEKLKGRTLADRVALSSVSEAPKSPGKPKTYAVICGPVKDPDLRLAVLLSTTSDKVSDMNPGTEFSFTGKIAGARYDATAMMVVVQVGEATIQ